MEYPCVLCKVHVGNTNKALQCKLYENWEHVDCVRECEGPDSTLYEALVRYHTMFVICMHPLPKKGSLIKQFMTCEYELAHTQHERLASAHLLEQAEAHVRASEQVLADLKQECDALQTEVKKLYKE